MQAYNNVHDASMASKSTYVGIIWLLSGGSRLDDILAVALVEPAVLLVVGAAMDGAAIL